MQWEVYPNPASSLLTIANQTGHNIQRIEVLDINGKLVLSTPVISSLETQLSVAMLQTGMYTIRVLIEDSYFNKRFIKQ